MNAWVQAVVWRYKAGLLSDPVVACAEELMYVFNNLKHTNYTSIDEELDGWVFPRQGPSTLSSSVQRVFGVIAQYMNTNMLVLAPITTPPMMFRLCIRWRTHHHPASAVRADRKEGRLHQPQQGPFRCSIPHPVRQWHLLQGGCHRERWNLYAVAFGCGALIP